MGPTQYISPAPTGRRGLLPGAREPVLRASLPAVTDEAKKESSPATLVLVTLIAIFVVVCVLAWPWPRLCFDDPTFANCNPMLWLKRAIARALGG